MTGESRIYRLLTRDTARLTLGHSPCRPTHVSSAASHSAHACCAMGICSNGVGGGAEPVQSSSKLPRAQFCMCAIWYFVSARQVQVGPPGSGFAPLYSCGIWIGATVGSCCGPVHRSQLAKVWIAPSLALRHPQKQQCARHPKADAAR
jgi:hypothetical protein